MHIKSLFLIIALILSPLFLQARATRVMPLGDSITYDDSYADYDGHSRPASVRHAYRNYLWYRLRDARYEADFVGSRIAGTAVVPHFDPENEGYPGQTSDYIANIVYSKLVQNPADIILLHIGTNDRWSIDSSGNHMSGMQNIFNEVDRFERDYHHHVKIILALIIGRRNNDFSSFTNTFNSNLNSLAHQRISQGDDIVIIDMQHNAGINYNHDFRDPAHPTNTGYSKMANLWYNALRPYLHKAPPPIPSKPTHLTTNSVTHNTVSLHWNDTSSNESGFRIWVNGSHIATLGAGSTGYTVHNLHPNTTYTINIQAYNGNGNSARSTITVKTAPPPIPTAPTHFRVHAVTPKSVTLQWTDTSSNENGFKIWNHATHTRVATLGRNVTTYTMSNLEPRTTYTFEIRAYNHEGNSAKKTITFTTPDDYGWLPAVYHVILF